MHSSNGLLLSVVMSVAVSPKWFYAARVGGHPPPLHLLCHAGIHILADRVVDLLEVAVDAHRTPPSLKSKGILG